jgi:hypothetical protein
MCAPDLEHLSNMSAQSLKDLRHSRARSPRHVWFQLVSKFENELPRQRLEWIPALEAKSLRSVAASLLNHGVA